MAGAMIGPVRFSFMNIFKPKRFREDQDAVFSVCCMYPKDDKKVAKQLDDAIQSAIKKGLEDNVIKANHVKHLALPVYDGTEKYEAGDRGKEFEGMLFFNTGRPEDRGQPGIVDADRQPIVDQNQIYSGCWGYVFVNFYAYSVSGKRGVGCSKGLQHVMFWKEDVRLDGNVDVDDAFKDVPTPTPDEEAGDLT